MKKPLLKLESEMIYSVAEICRILGVTRAQLLAQANESGIAFSVSDNKRGFTGRQVKTIFK